MNVNCKYGVTATAMLVHVVSSDRPVLQALLQHSQQVVQLSAFNAAERIAVQNKWTINIHRLLEICFGHLNRLSTTNALLRLFQRTVKLERFAPGFSKSITCRVNLPTICLKPKNRQVHLLVIDFEVGGFDNKRCVVFSLLQLVKKVDERPDTYISKWNDVNDMSER